MPRPSKSQPQKNMRQTTLLGHYDTSPVRSSPKSPKQFMSQAGSSPTKSRRAARRDESGASESEDTDEHVGTIRFERQSSSSAVDITDDEDEPVSPRSSFKRPASRILDSDDEIESTEVMSNAKIVKGKTGIGKRKASLADLNEDDLDSPPARKKKLVKGKRPARVSSADEETDLADEVEPERIVGSRLRSRNKMSAFQKSLEKLKRRKLKRSEQSESGSESEEQDLDEPSIPFAGARPTTGSDLDKTSASGEEDSEDAFIVEDDGVAAELPPEFSMNTHQDLVHHFKIIFQFFVHIAVQPAPKREQFMKQKLQDEQYFYVPVQIARRKISGMRDSLVASSVWKPWFKKILETLPHFERAESRLIREFIQPLEKDDDSDDSEDSEDSEVEMEDMQREFNLGRFCAKRVRVFHAFTHWEYMLFESIDQELSELKAKSSGRAFVRVSHAGGMKPPEDLTDADTICEWLDQRQVVEREWQIIRKMMESARHLEMIGRRGGDEED